MKHVYFRISLAITLFLMSLTHINAQCTISGLNANYCVNSAVSTLTPGIPGGTFTGPGISGSTFDPSLAGPGTQTITYAVCNGVYSVTAGTYDTLTTSGTAVILGDDDVSAALPIGFTFNFFCNAYTNFYIGSNGFITFTSTTFAGCCVGRSMPTPANSNLTFPDNLIAAAWVDLFPPQQGSITYTTLGTAPTRTLVVSYNNILHYNHNAPKCCPVSTQVQIFEGTDIIEIHSTSIPPAISTSPLLYLTTQGIENSGGTIGYSVPGRNAVAGWTATNDCYRFTPQPACLITQTTSVNATTVAVNANNPVCLGSTATLTALGNTTYTWSTGSHAASITAAPVTNTTYTVTGTNSHGCVASSAITVTVNVTPTVSASNSNGAGPVCPRTPFSLNGTGANTYTWTGGITNATSFTLGATTAYTVQGTNACGTRSAAITVSVSPSPTILVSVNHPTICNLSAVTLSASGASTYTWSNGVANNTAFTPSATAGYTVIGTSALGCTNSAVTSVTVLLTPTITPVASSTAICAGDNATLTAVGANTYSWNPGGATTSSIIVSPGTSTTYTLFRTNGACSYSTTLGLVVNTLPNINITTPNPTTTCEGQPTNLNVVGAITYVWQPNNITGSSVIVYPSVPTVYTVTAYNNFCSQTATISVTTKPNPTVTVVSNNSVICLGASSTLSVTGALSYTWQSPIPVAQQNQTSVVVTPSVSSIYNVIGTNAVGCSVTQGQVVVVNSAPTISPTVVNASYICAGDIATLDANALSTGPVTYSWSNGSTISTPTVAPASTTIYTLIVTDQGTSCKATGTVALAVYISTFVVSSPSAVCKGSTVTISATGAASSYSWNTGATGSSIQVSPAATTVYSVTGTTGSCQTMSAVTVPINQTPNVTATAAIPTVCKFDPAVLNASSTSPGVTFTWDNGQTGTSITVTPSITTPYVVTATDANGCSKTSTITQFVSICTGIAEAVNVDEVLSIYPNPSSGEFMISGVSAMNVSIINEIGQVVRKISLTAAARQVSITALANGIYFIIAEKDGSSFTKKVIVNK